MPQSNYVRIGFEHGVDEYDEPSVIPEGFGTVVQNWVPEADGSLRVPRAWQQASSGGLTGSRIVRGFGYYAPNYTLAQASSGSAYKVAYGTLTGGWTAIETVTATSTDVVKFATGAGVVLYASRSFPSARIRKWNGTAASDASTDVLAGRALVFHNNRFFAGGTNAEPTREYWSELGDPATWNIGTNFQPIVQEDGEPIEDMVTWDRNLLIGKESSVTYQSGFGPDTFAWHTLDGGGCAPGRTLVPTPAGICAIGRERVWLFRGSSFEPISQPVESSYGMTGSYMSGAYVDGIVFISDTGSGTIWTYNLGTGAWSTELFEDSGEGPGLLWARNSYLLGGAKAAVANPYVLYRQIPGSERTAAPNTDMVYRATSGQIWHGLTAKPSTLMRLHLRLRQRGANTFSSPLSVSVTDETGSATTHTITPHTSESLYHERLTFGVTGYSHQIDITHEVAPGEAAVVDVEDVVAEYQVENSR
jgi:hypothetical protein